MRTIDGIEVLDGALDEELVVTEEDIAKAIPLDHHKCALAVSWRRMQPELQDTIVGKSRAFKLKDHFGYLKWFRYGISTSIKIQQAVLDNGGHMSPGIYTLKSLPKSQRTGKQQGSDKDPDKPKPQPTLIKTKGTRVITPMRTNIPVSST
jgi:hypothetical protein